MAAVVEIDRRAGTAADADAKVVEVRGLHARYGQPHAVDDVSRSLQRGEFRHPDANTAANRTKAESTVPQPR